MAIVNHRQGIKFPRELANADEVGDGAIHREYAVRHDQFGIGTGRVLKLASKVLHVAVRVAKSFGLR